MIETYGISIKFHPHHRPLTTCHALLATSSVRGLWTSEPVKIQCPIPIAEDKHDFLSNESASGGFS